jgi:hypothetical protein
MMVERCAGGAGAMTVGVPGAVVIGGAGVETTTTPCGAAVRGGTT